MDRRTFCLWLGLTIFASIISKIDRESASNNPTFAAQPQIPMQPIIYYISPQGNDLWSGLSPQPDKQSPVNGPFKTLEKARDAIRLLKQKTDNELKQPVKVILAGGQYFLERPFKLTVEDSGTENTPITYESDSKQPAILSGGKQIVGWQAETLNQKTVWTVTIPEVRQGKWYFEQLWVNGSRRHRARYPTQGYLKIEAVEKTANWKQGQTSFQYVPKDLPQGINWQQGEAVVLHRWVESRLPITEIDETQHRLNFSKKSVFQLDPGDLYYIENVLAVLDTPGEWYLNRNNGKLYYFPLPEEQIETVEIIAPRWENVLVLEGKAAEDLYVTHQKFKNLVFAHTHWLLPSHMAGFTQNGHSIPATISANGIQSCAWESCRITNIGNYALELFRGCQYNRIVNCQFSDLGAGGIKIGERLSNLPQISPLEVSHHNQIINNQVGNGGKFYPSAVGIRAVHSHNNHIAHNHVHNFYYTGIAVRGTWGFHKTNAYENIVEYNNVHHIGRLADGDGPILSDMGGIYTLGSQEGTIIRGNTIHDVAAVRYGGRGIYFDEGSAYIVAENNLVYRTTHGGFAQHYGKENIIRNNIFAFGEKMQIYRARRDYNLAKERQHLSMRFECNILFWDSGELMGGVTEDPTSNVVFDYNTYWSQDKREINFANLSWEQWRELGEDRNSKIANPLFISPNNKDFRLSSQSPALALGFQPNAIPLF
jgi:hypothetical protein